MSDLTFLTHEQCYGDRRLDIFDRRTSGTEITDFSILLGGLYEELDKFDKEGHRYHARYGSYWTKTVGRNANVYICMSGGPSVLSAKVYDSYPGIRPVLPIPSSLKIPANGAGETLKRGQYGIWEVEYGYYPQQAVSSDMQEILENAYQTGRLLKTKKKYTTGLKEKVEDGEKTLLKEYDEFEFDSDPDSDSDKKTGSDKKRYVRVEANPFFKENSWDKRIRLSNGVYYRAGDPIWIEVQPVKWLIDVKEKIMLTENIIFAGIQFNQERDCRTEDFDRTDIKEFMDTYLTEQLELSKEIVKSDETSQRVTETATTEPLKRANNSENISQNRDSTPNNLVQITAEEPDKKLEANEKRNEAAKRKKDLIDEIIDLFEEGNALDEQIATARERLKKNR